MRCDRCTESRLLLAKAVERQAYLEAIKIASKGLKDMVLGHKERPDELRKPSERVGKGD